MLCKVAVRLKVCQEYFFCLVTRNSFGECTDIMTREHSNTIF